MTEHEQTGADPPWRIPRPCPCRADVTGTVRRSLRCREPHAIAMEYAWGRAIGYAVKDLVSKSDCQPDSPGRQSRHAQRASIRCSWWTVRLQRTARSVGFWLCSGRRETSVARRSLAGGRRRCTALSLEGVVQYRVAPSKRGKSEGCLWISARRNTLHMGTSETGTAFHEYLGNMPWRRPPF